MHADRRVEELLHSTRYNLVNTGLALMPDKLSIAPSPLHYRLSDALVGSRDSTVIAFPREFGKSTYVWDVFSNHNVLHRQYRYIVYIAATSKIAEKQFYSLKGSIKTHPLLKTGIEITRDTKDEFFYEAAGEKFFITCHGAHQQLRGARFDQYRPDLIIIDDIEKSDEVMSPDMRAKLKDWFFADVLPLGKEARLFYVGTMLHEDSLLANLVKTPLTNLDTGVPWRTFRYGVLDDEGSPTWPEKYDEAWISAKRKSYIANGMLYRFNTEYMNIAVGTDDRTFDPTRIRMYNPEQLRSAMNGSTDIIITVDPGIKKSVNHDPTVIMTTMLDSLGQMWMLNVVRKRMALHEILDAIVEEYKMWSPRMVYVESVQGQDYLVQELENGMWPGGYIMPIERIEGKQVQMGKVRIYGLESLFHNRKLLAPASAEWWVDFVDELVTFPRGKHDDILDCASYAKMNHVAPGSSKINVDDYLVCNSSTVFA